MTTLTAQLRPAQLPQDHDALVALIQAYVAWLDMDMSFQNFDDEMAQFDSIYSLPHGMFWVAQAAGILVGCVAFKHLDERTAEVKRLYVQPAFRGQRLGDQLMQLLVEKTRQLGYQRLVLDTVPKTVAAQAIYLRMGFKPIAPYYSGHTLATAFFELAL